MNRFGNKILSLLLFVPSSVLAAQTTTFICLSDHDRSYMALVDKKKSGQVHRKFREKGIGNKTQRSSCHCSGGQQNAI